MKFKSTSKIFVMFVAFCAECAFAGDQIESEFELVLPKSFQQNIIEQKWNSLATQRFSANWQFPNQIIENAAGIKVHLEGISVDLSTQLKKPTLQNGQRQTLLDLKSSDLQAKIKITKISVNQVIEQTVGGITGRFELKADCPNVTLQMGTGKGSFGIVLNPAVAGTQIGAQVSDVNLAWQADAWRAQPFTCTGAQGFEDLVMVEIQKVAADSANFVNPRKDLIMSYVKDYLSSFQIDLSQKRQLISVRDDIKTSMIIDAFDDSQSDRMIAKGRVFLDFMRLASKNVTKLTLSSKDSSYNIGANAILRLPGAFTGQVMTKAYAANSWVHSLSSSQLPGFSTIMSSRLYQFMLWPELMNYPRSTKFNFNVYSNKDPQITGSGLLYNLNLNLLTQMHAPKKGKYVPFMYFSFPFTSKVAISVVDNQIKAVFSNVDMNIKAYWYKSYIDQYSPSKNMAVPTIQSRILDAISGQSTTFKLPEIPVMTGLTLRIKKASILANSDLVLLLEP